MSNSPLLDTFKRGEVNRELKLLAAEAVVAPRAEEQLELLVMLAGDVAKGIQPAETVTAGDAPLIDASPEVEETPEGEETQSALQRIANMNVAKRIALAMRGNREERAILIRDPNRNVTAAVLSSPKMSETEAASIAKKSATKPVAGSTGPSSSNSTR